MCGVFWRHGAGGILIPTIRPHLHRLLLFLLMAGAWAQGALAEPAVRRRATANQESAISKDNRLVDLKQRAEAGAKTAQYELGLAYYVGQEVPKDLELALKWFRQAALQGHPRAQFQAYILLHRKPDEQSQKEGVRWLKEAASQSNIDPEIIYSYAMHLFEASGSTSNQPTSEAVEWLHKAAVAGDIVAQYSYGEMLLFGEAGVAKNPKEGIRELERVAPYFSSAYLILGDAYRFGLGVERNLKKAFQYYQNGSENNDTGCRIRLVECSLSGIGTTQNWIETLENYRDLRDPLEELARSWKGRPGDLEYLLPPVPETDVGAASFVPPTVTPDKALEIENEIKKEIASTIPKLGQPPELNSVVAMYVDVDADDSLHKPETINFRCYAGYGYSGDQHIQTGKAFATIESMSLNMSENPDRKLFFDAGPPYEQLEIPIRLVPGGVTNLGRVVLRKLKARNPIRIIGQVRDLGGTPLPAVRVGVGPKVTDTDEKGYYQLDGFGLEKFALKAQKDGYLPEEITVSIRNDRRRNLRHDLVLVPPLKIKIRYGVSAKGKDALSGPEVESGVWEGVLGEGTVNLDKVFNTPRMLEFCRDAGLTLVRSQGLIKFQGNRCFVFYKMPYQDISFDEIHSAGSADVNTQRCPLLSKGSKIIILGSRPWGEDSEKISDYNVKVEIEELSPIPPS